MKLPILTFALGVSALALAAPASADNAREEYIEANLPHSKEALRELNSEQIRIVRRAANLCAGAAASTGLKDQACVISMVDDTVAKSDDPELIAFHYAIPTNQRYDRLRSNIYWQNLVSNEYDDRYDGERRDEDVYYYREYN